MRKKKTQSEEARRIKKYTQNNQLVFEFWPNYPDDHSAVVLPDSIPNSEVKRSNADGSVVIRHVRVEHHRVLLNR